MEPVQIKRGIKLINFENRFVIRFRYNDGENWIFALPVKNMYFQTESQVKAQLETMQKDPLNIKHKTQFQIAEIVEEIKERDTFDIHGNSLCCPSVNIF